MQCPNCQEENTLIPIQRDHVLKYRGRKLLQVVHGYRCMSCKESFISPDKDPKYQEKVDNFIVKVTKETEHYTCNTCVVEGQCPYRWDPYNTNGDCLQMK